MYRFKSQCASINELFYKLEGCLSSRQKNKLKKFLPISNEFLPPSKNITLTDNHIMYPMKQKNICEYYTRCIMSIGLIFDDVIMDIIRNNKLAHPTEENNFLFTNIENKIVYMYRESLQKNY